MSRLALAPAEFERAYAERSGLTLAELRAELVVRPCDCGYEDCEGWQMVTREHAERIDDPGKPWAR